MKLGYVTFQNFSDSHHGTLEFDEDSGLFFLTEPMFNELGTCDRTRTLIIMGGAFERISADEYAFRARIKWKKTMRSMQESPSQVVDQRPIYNRPVVQPNSEVTELRQQMADLMSYLQKQGASSPDQPVRQSFVPHIQREEEDPRVAREKQKWAERAAQHGANYDPTALNPATGQPLPDPYTLDVPKEHIGFSLIEGVAKTADYLGTRDQLPNPRSVPLINRVDPQHPEYRPEFDGGMSE